MKKYATIVHESKAKSYSSGEEDAESQDPIKEPRVSLHSLVHYLKLIRDIEKVEFGVSKQVKGLIKDFGDTSACSEKEVRHIFFFLSR